MEHTKTPLYLRRYNEPGAAQDFCAAQNENRGMQCDRRWMDKWEALTAHHVRDNDFYLSGSMGFCTVGADGIVRCPETTENEEGETVQVNPTQFTIYRNHAGLFIKEKNGYHCTPTDDDHFLKCGPHKELHINPLVPVVSENATCQLTAKAFDLIDTPCADGLERIQCDNEGKKEYGCVSTSLPSMETVQRNERQKQGYALFPEKNDLFAIPGIDTLTIAGFNEAFEKV